MDVSSDPALTHLMAVDLGFHCPLDSHVNSETAVIMETARVIASGGVVALPTDTLYGLAVDPCNPTAVERLFQIKRRHPSRPISLLISDRAMLREWVSEVTPAAARLMEIFWPGPLTLIFKGTAPQERLTAGTGTIAIRLPDDPFLVRLINALGRPITATSANISGGPDLHSAQEVLSILGEGVDLIIDGGIRDGLSSTLVDVTGTTPTLVRPGAVPISSLSPYFSVIETKGV